MSLSHLRMSTEAPLLREEKFIIAKSTYVACVRAYVGLVNYS